MVTVSAVALLILVGGIVRSTGSGMGCPDWPKCFGQWVPPTDIAQLPADYKERFRVAGRTIADFDAFKTWVEYINRLLGVLIGLLALATAAASLPLRRIMPAATGYSFAGLFFVVLAGGVGAIVVRTHLSVGVITIHMVIALLSLAAFTAALIHTWREVWAKQAAKLKAGSHKNLWFWSLLALASIAVQIVIGTQLREAIDGLAEAGATERSSWLSALDPGIFALHKSFYFVTSGLVIAWLVYLRKYAAFRGLSTISLSIAGLLGAEIVAGFVLQRFALPPAVQPVHLFLAVLLFTLSFALCLALWTGIRHAGMTTPMTVSSHQPETV